jgi:hypothetical protein
MFIPIVFFVLADHVLGFATLLRNPRGIDIVHTRINSAHILDALLSLPEMTEHKSLLLLDPSDKMNVPGAIDLLNTLEKLETEDGMSPGEHHRRRCVMFIAHWLGLFVMPFISLTATLGERLRSLSAYAYITAAIYLECGTRAMTGALYADSQAIVKNVFFLVARSQLVDPNISLHLLFEGTDRLEELFGEVRTSDHARNFDVLQLSHKLAIGTILHAIFQAHPDIARPHKAIATSNKKGVDHGNPVSVTGNCRVGDFELPLENKGGINLGKRLLQTYFPKIQFVDLRVQFAREDKERNFSCPDGTYVGHSHASQALASDDNDDIRSENEPHGHMQPPLPDPAFEPVPAAQAILENHTRAGYTLQGELSGSETGSETDPGSEDNETELGPSEAHQANTAPITSLPSTVMRYELPSAVPTAAPEVDLDGADLESLLEQPSDIEPPSAETSPAVQPDAQTAAVIPRHSAHLKIDDKLFFKSNLVPAFTSVPGDKRVIMRTLRSAGLTLEKMTEHQRRVGGQRRPIGETNVDDGVKADDLCAILVRCGDALCLAVVQINEFRLGPQKVPLTRITQQDLDGDPSTRVYGYILDLEATDIHPEFGIENWLWTQAVVCLNRKSHQTGKLPYQNYMIDFPAWQMHLLAPSVVYHDLPINSHTPDQHRETSTWMLSKTDLEGIFDYAIKDVMPDTRGSTSNIVLLPAVESSDAFPYHHNGGKLPFTFCTFNLLDTF